MRLSLSLVPLACALGLGCVGADVLVRDHTVVAPNLSYQFGPVPPSWRTIAIEGNDVAWYDEDSAGVVHVDHTCERTQDTPLPALVAHLLIGFTDRETVLEETLPFDQREARHVVVRARLDGVPRVLELYVMKKDGCVYDLGLVVAPERHPRVQGAFQRFAAGFHTRRSPLEAGR